MSQLSSSVSLPQIAHRGVPVVTTETLAQAYEVDAVSIRKNFSCNKARFTEGKHYYTLSGNDLREFKNRVTESNSVQIGKNSRSLTLWTERGAARHAKMLNSDRAWDNILVGPGNLYERCPTSMHPNLVHGVNSSSLIA